MRRYWLILMLAMLAMLSLAAPILTVAPGSRFYEPGSLVTLEIRGPSHAVVGVEVRGPKGELVFLDQVVLDAAGRAVLSFKLGPSHVEGVYMVYAATPGAMAKASFIVAQRPPVTLILAPPGQVRVGEEAVVYCFAYPGVRVKVTAFTRIEGGDWIPIGEYEANSSGWIAFKVKAGEPGVHEVKVVYSGSPEYAPSSAMASFRAVEEPAPSWRVAAPPVKWLNESIILECMGCDLSLIHI